MPRVVRAGLIQAGIGRDSPDDIQALRRFMLDKHVALVDEAAGRGVEILCLQELFTGPYFPAEQNDRWRQLAEPVPDGPDRALDAGVGPQARHGNDSSRL